MTETGGKDFIDQSFDYLVKEIQKVSLKSPWDVENRAENVILYSTDMDAFTKIKDYLYEHPFYAMSEGEDIRLSLPFLVQIMGVYLRNLYLEKYPFK